MRMRPDIVKGGLWADTAAACHDRTNQRLPVMSVSLDRQSVRHHAAVSVIASPDLLASGPGRFSCRALAARQTSIFLQLVGTVERRRVERRHQAGPNTDAIDRRFFARECRQRVLVDPAAHKDA